MARPSWIYCSLISLSLVACTPQSSDTGDEDSVEGELPNVEVNLPSPPSFEKENAPETYTDGAYSVYGLRKNKRTTAVEQEEPDAALCNGRKSRASRVSIAARRCSNKLTTSTWPNIAAK